MEAEAQAYGVINVLNANPFTGVPTPSSFVRLDVIEYGTAAVQVDSNTLNQPLSLQVRNNYNTTNPVWVTVSDINAFKNVNTGAYSSTIPAGANGVWIVNVAGIRAMRVAQITAVSTGSANVALNAQAGTPPAPAGAGGGGSGQQYAEGANVPTATGTAILIKDASNNERQPSFAYPMPTNPVNRTNLFDQATTITSSTTETTIGTADATLKNDMYMILATNTSATATEVIIRSSTAGTPRFSMSIPAGDTRGFTLPAHSGLKQAAAASNWTAQCGTSVASVKIVAAFIKNT